MKRFWLGVLACLILGNAGCVTESDKKQWAAAWADFRGDNQEMHGYGSSSSDQSSMRP